MEIIGRRERKKIQLRDALIKASYELFAEKGFNNTRIEDITEKVDVSTRTFFRYFSSKEDVVFDYQEAEHEDFIDAFNRRPVQEPILSTIRCASVEIVKSCEQGSYGFDADRFITLQELLRTHPLVRARDIKKGESRRGSIVSLIAQRMGVNPTLDIRPIVLAGVLDYAHVTAHEIWKTHNQEAASYSDVLNKVFLMIEDGLNFTTIC